VKKNQKGFSLLETVFCLVIILAISGVALYIYHSKSGYQVKDITLALDSSVDNNQYSTSLSIVFGDSAYSTGCSSERVAGFIGKTQLSYSGSSTASIKISQNMKPNKSQSKQSSTVVDCPQDLSGAPDPVSKTLNFDEHWVESMPHIKNIFINGRHWTLTLDNKAYTLTLAGPDGQSTVVSRLPLDVKELTAANSCNTLGRLTSFANANHIELAEQKYPGITEEAQKYDQYMNGSKSNIELLIINSSAVNALPTPGLYSGVSCTIEASNFKLNTPDISVQLYGQN